MITRRSTFTLLLYSLNQETVQRAIAAMRAIHEHQGRAWLMLDQPVPNMPPRIIGLNAGARP